jgi:hypothetical protein
LRKLMSQKHWPIYVQVFAHERKHTDATPQIQN